LRALTCEPSTAAWSIRLDSGELVATPTTIRAPAPLQGGASAGTPAQSITALVSGGAFFLTFEDGTVVSASVLCPRQAVPGALGSCPANHAYDV
jgi:hypothetical protein